MIKTIKQKLGTIALASTLLFSPYSANADTSIKLNSIISNTKPISRVKVVVKDLPYNSDIFVVNEGDSAEYKYYKQRLQIFPIGYKNSKLGIALQHMDASSFKPHQEGGLVLRLKQKPSKRSFFKSDLRYFKETNTFDTSTFLGTGDFLLDLIWSYNHDTDRIVLLSGIDYNINDKLSIGLESKTLGTKDNPKTDYTGIRLGCKF